MTFEEFMIDLFMNENPDLYKNPKAEDKFTEWVNSMDFDDIAVYVQAYIDTIKKEINNG